MTIDLRYVLPIVAFYVPGVMMLLGGLALGFSLDEMRDGVAIFGSSFGGAICLIVALSIRHSRQIKVRLFK